jgi:tRNA(Ile)-lysidine synthase
MRGALPLGAHDLAGRVVAHMLRNDAISPDDLVVVAVSGGRDSMALLHLLRFADALPPLRLVAAHLDHAMRPSSADDADWVAGVCRTWGVPCRMRRCDPAPRTEAEARRLRYQFLEEVRREERARWVVTGHQADDQAETVLFRAVRGTGIGGLRGIRARRRQGLWRPLLPFTRAELTAYAEAVGLSWRDDPTNEPGPTGAAPARSVIRSYVLPELERRVMPGAGRALASLARRARENEAAWASLLPGLLARMDLRREGDVLSVSRAALLEFHPAVRARVVRELAKRLGARPGEAGTRTAVEFSSSGSSGTAVPLGGGVELRIELERLVLGPARGGAVDEPLAIPGPERGEGVAVVGGRRYRVSWGPRPEGMPWSEAFDVAGLRFPLSLRGWAAGDRARMAYGTKKLKKLFLEARVSPAERHRIPVLADGGGVVLWVPGVARSAEASREGAAQLLHIGVRDAQSA